MSKIFDTFESACRTISIGRRNKAILNDAVHGHVSVWFRALTLVSISLLLPGCTTVSHGGLPAIPTTPVVRVQEASDSEGQEAAHPVSDAEVSAAQAALSDASAWGAKYYKPEMYAKAQAAFDEANAARIGDPPRCRSLLAEAAAAASSAREAALQAYEADVNGRFEGLRSKLVDVRADRAFPGEFAQLLEGRCHCRTVCGQVLLGCPHQGVPDAQGDG